MLRNVFPITIASLETLCHSHFALTWIKDFVYEIEGIISSVIGRIRSHLRVLLVVQFEINIDGRNSGDKCESCVISSRCKERKFRLWHVPLCSPLKPEVVVGSGDANKPWFVIGILVHCFLLLFKTEFLKRWVPIHFWLGHPNPVVRYLNTIWVANMCFIIFSGLPSINCR